MMQVLRGAGYPDQALWVAHQADQPEWMLEIMIDDMGDYSQAIGFLVEVCLTVPQCALNLQVHTQNRLSTVSQYFIKLMLSGKSTFYQHCFQSIRWCGKFEPDLVVFAVFQDRTCSHSANLLVCFSRLPDYHRSMLELLSRQSRVWRQVSNLVSVAESFCGDRDVGPKSASIIVSDSQKGQTKLNRQPNQRLTPQP